MKTLRSYPFYLLFLLPFSVFGQNTQLNPQVQQQVNLYGGTNFDINPQALNNEDNINDFFIHEQVQANKNDENIFEQQQVSNKSKHGSVNPISFGSGATSGSVKMNLKFRKTKLKFDKKMHRIFHKAPKKKRSSTSCFSWS